MSDDQLSGYFARELARTMERSGQAMREDTRRLELKHETAEDRERRHQADAARARAKYPKQLPVEKTKGFIAGIHDRRWQDGPPEVLLAEYATMEAQHSDYRELRDTWLPMTN